jgi:hypothetical protein
MSFEEAEGEVALADMIRHFLGQTTEECRIRTATGVHGPVSGELPLQDPSLEEEDHFLFVVRIRDCGDQLPASVTHLFVDVFAQKTTVFVGFEIVSAILHLWLQESIKEQSCAQFSGPNCQNQEEKLFVAHSNSLCAVSPVWLQNRVFRES